MTGWRARGVVTRLAAAGLLAAGLWTAGGVLSVEQAAGGRLALLPPLWVPVGWFVVAAAVLLFWYPGPLSPLAAAALLLLLPWVPLPIPPVFLIWLPPLTLVAGAALVVALLVRRVAHARAPIAALWQEPRRAPLTVAVLSVLLYGGAAWRVSPFIPGGDEPHYLIITQSLLSDFDLKIENNHARGDYRAYYAGDLRPDYVVRGRDGDIYSIHMPGVSALVAPAFLVAGHAGAVAFAVVLAALAGALLWWLAYRVTRSVEAAWFGWAAAALSVPVVLHAFTVYPDGMGILPVMAGLYALVRAGEPASVRVSVWAGCGLALAILPWLHSRFALVAAVLGAMVCVRLVRARGGRRAAWFLAAPAAAAPAWFGFFYVIYGSPDPRVQYGAYLQAISSMAYVPGGIGGLLFDAQFGVLPYAPVVAAAFAGLVLLLRAADRSAPAGVPARLLGLTLMLLVVPYLISTTTMRMWWGGSSAPGRFLATLLPPLGLAAAVAWQQATRPATRAALTGALALSLTISATLVWVDRGRLAYNVRQAEPLWLEWASPVAALSRGVPTFLRTTESAAWVHTAIWVALAMGGWLAVRSADRGLLHGRVRVSIATAVAWALAASVATAAVWRLNGVSGLDPVQSQVRLLRAAAEDRGGAGVVFDPLRPVAAAELVPRLLIEPPARFASARNLEAAVLPGPLPAGEYAIEARATRAAGRLTIGIGRTHVPIATLDLAAGEDSIALRLPVDVRALVVRGDAAALEAVNGVAFRPAALVTRGSRVGPEFARQAVRYGGSTAYFFDDRSFPEPSGFWVGGARSSIVAIAPDRSGGTVALLVRNGPAPNRALFEARHPRSWNAELQLSPGEERQLIVPVDAARGVAVLRVDVASGFRPSEHDPSSGDARFLGVWIAVSP